MTNININIIRLQDGMMGKCCWCCYVKIYSSKKIEVTQVKWKNTCLSRWCWSEVRPKVQAVEHWRPAMFPRSQPEDKAFSELLAPNLLGVTACMLIFKVFFFVFTLGQFPFEYKFSELIVSWEAWQKLLFSPPCYQEDWWAADALLLFLTIRMKKNQSVE